MVGAQWATLRFGACLGAATALQSKNRLVEAISSGWMISGPSYPALFSTSDFNIFLFASKYHLHF